MFIFKTFNGIIGTIVRFGNIGSTESPIWKIEPFVSQKRSSVPGTENPKCIEINEKSASRTSRMQFLVWDEGDSSWNPLHRKHKLRELHSANSYPAA